MRDAKAVPSITDPAPESREVGLDALMAGRDDEPAAIEAGSDKD